MRVYHGGTAFNDQKLERHFAAANGGSVGYYVTADYQQAQGYGDVYTYEFIPEADMSTSRLTEEQAEELNLITKYWECYGESPYNQEAIGTLMSDNAYDALMEVINSTGEIDKAIKFMRSLGYTHASQSDPSVIIAIDNLELID